MKRQMRTRTVQGLLGIAAVGALALTACSGGGGDAGGSGSGGGGPLVVGVTTDIDTLVPWTATQFQSVNVLQNLYGTLTELDDDLTVVPGLAESWETSDDGLTVTFKLRPDVTFADGSEFDSADVIASYEAIQDESTAAVSAANLSSVTKMTAPDPTTVEMTLSASDAALVSKLAVITMAILPSDVDLAAIEKTPNGTGAFTLESRTPNESLTLAANEKYWDGAPKVDEVEFRVIPDSSAIVSALQAGNVQMAVFDDKLVADTIGGSVKVEETPQLSYHALQLNANKAPLDNVDVRLAIACAIDRQEVLDSAALGAGEVTGPITSPAFRSDPDARPCPTVDLDQAKKHLADAGKADGLTLNAIVMQDGYSTAVAEAENLQAQLKKVGITLNIEPLESGAYVDRWVAGDFELAVALNGGQPDPDTMYGRYFTSTGNLNAVAGYSSDSLDALFAKGRSELDEKARVKIYNDVAAELEDNAAWVWLFTGYSYTALADGVSGFTPLANGSLENLRNVTVK